MEHDKIDRVAIVKKASIRREYWHLKFEDIVFDDGIVRHNIERYAENLRTAMSQGLGLFLTGDYGQGKTMIASLLLKRALRERMSGFFISFFDFLDYYGGFDKDARQFRNYVKKVDFLVIDDLGSESIKARDYTFALLDNLMVERYKPTIFTSNKDSKALANLYGDHVLEFLGTGKIKEIFLDSGANRRNKGDWGVALESGREKEIIVEW